MGFSDNNVRQRKPIRLRPTGNVRPFPILNLLGYVAEPVYRHSHDTVMNEGEAGLREYCTRTTA